MAKNQGHQGRWHQYRPEKRSRRNGGGLSFQLSFPAAVPPLTQRPAVPLCSERVVVRWWRPPRLERSSLFWQPLTFALHQVEPRALVVENLTGGTGRPHKVLTMAGSRYDIARQMKLWNYLKHATECSFQAQSGQRQGLGGQAYPIWQQVRTHRCPGQGLDQWHSPCLSYHGW